MEFALSTSLFISWEQGLSFPALTLGWGLPGVPGLSQPVFLCSTACSRKDPRSTCQTGLSEYMLPLVSRPGVKSRVVWAPGHGLNCTKPASPSGLQAGVKKLSGEMAELRQHLEHYDKIQELVGMLQESHRCCWEGGRGTLGWPEQ